MVRLLSPLRVQPSPVMEDDQVDHIDHGADAGESKKKVIRRDNEGT